MSRIPLEVINQLKAETDLVSLIEASGVSLKKVGADLVGRCPFHEDKTPSLVVTPGKGLWHCLGACDKGGSVIDFVMIKEGVSLAHAIQLLKTTTSPDLFSKRNVKLKGSDDFELMENVFNHYRMSLIDSKNAMDYLKKRKLDSPEMINYFKIGYSNRTLCYSLPKTSEKEGRDLRLRLTSLGILRESGHEHFSGSIVVPITSDSLVTEIYGRKIKSDLNSPTHLYLKGPHCGVFNSYLLESEVILTEAIFDALSFYSLGFKSVTSSYGVNGFTKDLREALVSKMVSKVLIAYDNDDAGNSAATKLAVDLNELGIEAYRVVFPLNKDANNILVGSDNPKEEFAKLIRNAYFISAPKRQSNNKELGKDTGNNDTGNKDTGNNDSQEPFEEVSSSNEELLANNSLRTTLSSNLHQSTPLVKSREDGVIEVIAFHHVFRVKVHPTKPIQFKQFQKVNVAVFQKSNDYSGSCIGSDVSSYVDNVDLSSAKSRAIYAKEAALELGIDEANLRKDLTQLLFLLEASAVEKTEDNPPQMEDSDRQEALDLLMSEDLINQVLKAYLTLGVVGEADNSLLAYLTCISRKAEKPLGLLIQSSSAAGKSTLSDATLSLCPTEDVVSYSAMTGQSLYYLGDKDLKHKVLAIAEEEGAKKASYALKLLQSEGKLSIASAGKDPTTGRLVTNTYDVLGPVALITTTTAIDIDEELLNRLLVATVREDRGQTKAIHSAQREGLSLEALIKGANKESTIKLHQNAQRLLEALPVVLSNELSASLPAFPTTRTRSRRDHAKFLNLIVASALLHQHQREKNTVSTKAGEITYIKATVADIDLGLQLGSSFFDNSDSELLPQTKKVLIALINWAPKEPFSRKEAREALSLGDTQLKIHLSRLVDYEYLEVTRSSPFRYELPNAELPNAELSSDNLTSTDLTGTDLTGTEKATELDTDLELKPDRSGLNNNRSDTSRIPVAAQSDTSRGDLETSSTLLNGYIKANRSGLIKNHKYGSITEELDVVDAI